MKWINVNTNLPPDKQKCIAGKLIYLESEKKYYFSPEIMTFQKDKYGWDFIFQGYRRTVTHWMLLSDNPK